MMKIRIGRHADNDVVINDTSVSRYHAELFIQTDGSVSFTDLESTNGSFVNGKRVYGTIPLDKNDIVKVGTSLVPWRNHLDFQRQNQSSPVSQTTNNVKLQEGRKNTPFQTVSSKNKPVSERFWLFLAIGAVALLAIYFIFKVNSDKNKLVGVWYNVAWKSNTFHFKKDGDFTMALFGEESLSCKWELKNDSLLLNDEKENLIKYQYSFTSRDKLKLVDAGDTIQLERK
jgi:hypothetical protein